MDDLTQAFDERFQEIETYLQLLEGIEIEARSGPPRIGSAGAIITAQQQKILYSSVFLQLYNLVEATVVRCVDAVTDVAVKSMPFAAGDLTEALRREWVRVVARTHIDLNYANRLESALMLCDQVLAALPVAGFKMEKGGGGNWDDSEIEQVAARLGFELRVSRQAYQAVKRPFRDDLGPLGLVKKQRNSLAHGSISFSECGENLTVSELRDLATKTSEYLREVVGAFSAYISNYEFVVPAKRPTEVAA